MPIANKRSTIYLQPKLHRLLKLKSLETDQSISDLVNKALEHEFQEDAKDLAEFEKRSKEPTISYEDLLKTMKFTS